MGYLPNVTYYIDDVKVAEQADTRSTLRSGPVIVEKTDEEKAQIIGDALEAWIKGMVEHFKADVHAWDVVNEPMSNSNGSALQTGVGETDLASDVFYWQDILGKDYAVTAFKMARQYGNASDKLFINDYNLESNPNKLDGLIAYVEYIESKGATVDGIGTQMHVSIDSDTTMMKSMFQKLAATGKLIKVSELDVRINTSAPTVAQYASQAEMYRKIAELFNRYVPESQRYGITVWCVSDNEEEHTNWLPDDAPCLWNADYQRKHAYKGFADGLAGRDVSADFSGEIQY
jgi:GH35 family endo-1,4-beta-xylanase